MPSQISRVLAGIQPGAVNAIGALSGGRQAYQQGFDGEVLSQSKIAQALAQVRQADASAALHQQQARNAEAEGDILRGRGAVMDDVIAAAAGTSVPMLQAFRTQHRTGQAPMQDMGPPAADGTMGQQPMQIDPKVASALGKALMQYAPILGNTKDIKADDYAKAVGAFRDQGLGDQVLAGERRAADVGAAQAAVAGRPLYHADSTGAVLDIFGGGLNTANPMAQSTIGLRGAQAGQAKAGAAENYAQAANANASAGLHQAQTRKTLAEINMLDGMPGPQASRSQAAAALGVPLSDVDPYAGMAPKMADQVRKVTAANVDRLLTERGTQVEGEMAMARDAQRFKDLNKGNSTGGLNALPGAGAVRGAVDGEFGEMRAIANRLVPKMREPGSGATSDFDAKMFAAATIGTDKPQSTNRAIADAMIARAQLSADKLDFDRAYADVNGHLRGADRAWKQYVDANPIFDQAAQQQGRLALNPRRTSYQDFFRGRAGAAAPDGSAARGAPPAAGNVPQTGGRPPLDSFRR